MSLIYTVLKFTDSKQRIVNPSRKSIKRTLIFNIILLLFWCGRVSFASFQKQYKPNTLVLLREYIIPQKHHLSTTNREAVRPLICCHKYSTINEH